HGRVLSASVHDEAAASEPAARRERRLLAPAPRDALHAALADGARAALVTVVRRARRPVARAAATADTAAADAELRAVALGLLRLLLGRVRPLLVTRHRAGEERRREEASEPELHPSLHDRVHGSNLHGGAPSQAP